jgi:hypothetical protein
MSYVNSEKLSLSSDRDSAQVAAEFYFGKIAQREPASDESEMEHQEAAESFYKSLPDAEEAMNSIPLIEQDIDAISSRTSWENSKQLEPLTEVSTGLPAEKNTQSMGSLIKLVFNFPVEKCDHHSEQAKNGIDDTQPKQ